MKLCLRNARLINEGAVQDTDILINNDRFERIDPIIDFGGEEIDLKGQYVIPGVIDDQVHFREPGLTYKADIESESLAAAAGGVTSFMEMPNTKPASISQVELEKKYDKAARVSTVNYSFYMGASNDNLDEVLRTNNENVCGVKVFMGSSTGNMLVDDQKTLEALFAECSMLIATHCEDEMTVRQNLEDYKARYGDALTANHHPEIRSVEGCYLSSSRAVEMAQRLGTRLHILHITTAKELGLFTNSIDLKDKKITSEVCVHHLTFASEDYDRLGNLIKCNPAIKEESDRQALWKALLDDTIDVIATDHAPHTMEEKEKHYLDAPSGLPLIQHGLPMMLRHHEQGRIPLEKIVDKMCHKPAELFAVNGRGYVREGYFADLAIFERQNSTIGKHNVYYKCGWSPLEGQSMPYRVNSTMVNGRWVFRNGLITGIKSGRRLLFTPRN